MKRGREYRVWRANVIRRDKRCVICGSMDGRSAHHMNSWSYFPDERFDINNGVCLCRFHHTLFHTSYKRSFRTKCTKYDYKNFIEMIHKMRKHDEMLENKNEIGIS